MRQVINDQAHCLSDLKHDVVHLQHLCNEQGDHILALTCASGQTQVMVDAQSFKHDALHREMDLWVELMDKDAHVLSRICLELSGHVVSHRSQ